MTATDIAKKVLAQLELPAQREVLDWLHNEVYHPAYQPKKPAHVVPAPKPA